MPKAQMQVAVRGVVYPSARACAEAFGVSVNTVYDAVSRRDPDSIGLCRGGRKKQHGGGKPKKPIVIAGQRFESIADLARAIGRQKHNLRRSLKAGGLAKERIVRAVMALVAARENAAMTAAMLDRQEPEKEQAQTCRSSRHTTRSSISAQDRSWSNSARPSSLRGQAS